MLHFKCTLYSFARSAITCVGLLSTTLADANTQANSQIVQSFPSEFALSKLWAQVDIEGKPTQVYRFKVMRPVEQVRARLLQWLDQPEGPSQETFKNGWTYLSHKKFGSWVCVQFRSLDPSVNGDGSVEGLVSLWQDSELKPASTFTDSKFDAFSRIATLERVQIIRRLESHDQGRRALSLTVVSEQSVASLAASLSQDMKLLGLAPASFAPPLMRSQSNIGIGYPFISQAWAGNGSQVVFTVFEHRGKTAAQIYRLRGG
jgi:hypothetical protein